MRTLLFIVLLSLISSAYTARGINYEYEEQTNSLPPIERDARGLTYIGANIKKSAKCAWDAIKNIADNTKNKIKQWVGNVKDRAHSVKENMEERIKKIRANSKIALEKLVGTGKLVKECFRKENEASKEQIIKHVTSCITDALRKVLHLEKNGLQLELNETNFISEVENKMNSCETQNDIEECLNKVRQEMYLSMENVENKVLTTRIESRSITDDVLDAVISCSIEGLVDSSNVIAAESIKIIICVKDKQ